MKPSCVALGALLLASCSQDIQNTEAVRQAVIDHLASRNDLGLDMSAMQVGVESVNFRADEADAVVSFAPIGAAASAGMSMRYQLERDGDRWVVKGRSGAGDPAEGATGAELPPGHVPVQPGSAGSTELPADHPPLPGAEEGAEGGAAQ